MSGVSCTILVETLKCMGYWMQFLQVQLMPELVKILLWYAMPNTLRTCPITLNSIYFSLETTEVLTYIF